MATKRKNYASGDKLRCYYMKQCHQRQRGWGNYRPAFYAGVRFQRGRGFGSFFSNIFRWIRPLVKPMVRTVGRELGRAGINTLEDAIDGRNIGEAGKEHFKKAGSSLLGRAVNAVGTKFMGGNMTGLPLGILPGGMENLTRTQFRGIKLSSAVSPRVRSKSRSRRQGGRYSMLKKIYKKPKNTKKTSIKRDIFGPIRRSARKTFF